MTDLTASHWPAMMPGADKGADQGARKTLTVVAPWDLQPIAEVETAGAADVEQALATAARLHADRDAWLPQPERIGILRRLAALMREHAEVLAVEAAREGGKPLADSKVEVARAIDCVEICIETLRGHQGDVIPMNANAASAGRAAFTLTEPVGPVVAVSAFNHPLNLIAHQVAPAVATGCPVVVKPATTTPLSCLRFIALLREAGLPEDWAVPLVIEDNAVAQQLVTDPRVAFFTFIGSAKVGWMLRGQLAAGTRCALEHGGVAPVILADDADLDHAIPLLAKGGFYHAGQVCVSVQRIYAPRGMAETVAARLAAAGNAMQVADPTTEASDIGPLITPDELERVARWVDEATAAGATCISGGKRVSDTAYAPTVLLDPPDDAKVSQAEVFGPVVCVYAYDDLDEAIARANALEVSFQAAVFTQTLDTALRCYRRLNGAAVMVNDHTAFRVDWMPFAGLRHSGHGVGGIPYTMHDMQVQKLLVLRSDELR